MIGGVGRDDSNPRRCWASRGDRFKLCQNTAASITQTLPVPVRSFPKDSMPIPSFQQVMSPLLRVASDGEEHKLSEAVARLSDDLRLTEEERAALLPSGSQTLIHNRIAWASTYMRKAGLLESTRRGHFRITARGKQVLESGPPAINVRFLKQYPEFMTFHDSGRNSATEPTAATATDVSEGETVTPEESLETAVQRLRAELVTELIARVKTCSPEFFEKLVVALLLKMGYGGSRADAGRAIGRTGDGGIDGIIDEDRLGLDSIYIQAKRWEGTVGRPEIQKFVGALHGQRAKKGVFITTSGFSADAIDYAGRVENRLVLIDGRRLAELMIDFGVGVSVEATYEIKKIDSDFFVDE